MLVELRNIVQTGAVDRIFNLGGQCPYLLHLKKKAIGDAGDIRAIWGYIGGSTRFHGGCMGLTCYQARK